MSRNVKVLIAASFFVGILATLGISKLAAQACGGSPPPPFTDVTSFCQEIAQAWFTGLTNGTSPTTYSPDRTVTRGEMAAFITRTQNSALKRSSKRAALQRFWMPQNSTAIGLTGVAAAPLWVQTDGADIWVSSAYANAVSRVRASDGKLLETWTGAENAGPVLVAMGRIIVADQGGGGKIYSIDPSQTAGNATVVASSVGTYIRGIAFDGARIWTCGLDGVVSIVTPGTSLPWTVTKVTLGPKLAGILYDGANVWVADYDGNSLKKLDSSGNVLQVVSVSSGPGTPTFDGTNIWVPTDKTFAVTVVRASTGEVLATLSGNGLNTPSAASFDGQRVLVTNPFGNSVSLWNAADLSALGSISFAVASYPFYACSDGLNFWISLNGTNQLARF